MTIGTRLKRLEEEARKRVRQPPDEMSEWYQTLNLPDLLALRDMLVRQEQGEDIEAEYSEFAARTHPPGDD